MVRKQMLICMVGWWDGGMVGWWDGGADAISTKRLWDGTVRQFGHWVSRLYKVTDRSPLFWLWLIEQNYQTLIEQYPDQWVYVYRAGARMIKTDHSSPLFFGSLAKGGIIQKPC